MHIRLFCSASEFRNKLARLGWIVALALGPTAGLAQGARGAADSLRRAVAQHPVDSGSVRALVQLAALQLSQNQDSALYYAQRALVIAHRFPPLGALAWMQLGAVRYYQGQNAAAQQAYDSAYALAKRFGNSRQMGEALRKGGNVALERADFSRALANYRQAAQIHQAAGQVVEGGMALGNIGYLYKQIGDYDQALGIFFDELRVMEQAVRNPRLTAVERKKAASAVGNVLSYIGETYNRAQNWDQARVYLNRLLGYYQGLHDSGGIANTLANLANTNASSGRLGLAETQLRQSLAIQQSRHDDPAAGIAHANLGEILARQRKYASAEAEFRAAVRLYQQGSSFRQLPLAFVGLAGTQLALGRAGLARTALDSARQYLRRQPLKNEYASYYRTERDYFEQVGDPRRALQSFRLYELYKDSLLTAEKSKAMADLGIKYDTEKKEAQNRLQAAQLRTQQQIIRRRNTQLLAGLVVAALLAGLAYLLYNRRRLRREVEFAHERQQLERLRTQAVLEAEETERRRIGSDLHDGVGQLLTAAKLNLHALGEQLNVQTVGQQTLLQNALDVVDESFREVRGISHNLMPNALIKRGLALAVRDFLDKVTPDGRLKINLEVVGLDRGARLEPTTENVLFRVIQELMQNILKHARATEVTLQIIRHPQELTVLVEDNGVGFNPATLGKDAGIGLRNIESRMAFLGGRADFDAVLGRGTTVTLEVPLLAVVG